MVQQPYIALLIHMTKNGNRLTLRASGSHLQPAATVNYGYTGNKLTSLTKNGAAQSVNYTANAELYIGSTVPSYDYAGRRRGEGTSTTINRYMSYNANNEKDFDQSCKWLGKQYNAVCV